ncbi:MAG: T9SS type A sorting domain-containing protein [Chitinispirillaceae bacterium]|nr:T9SS type A sorting domain-containing protein [Chitinispirillaceae bacterium]
MKMVPLLMIFFFLGVRDAASAERITNFSSPKGVYDFEILGNIVWVATSGGLFHYSMVKSEASLRPANSTFPDPSVRALAHDAAGNLWAGSHDGYLLMRSPEGKEYFNHSYVSAGWRISDIASVGSYLVIASDKGVSLFDSEKRTVLKNATRIGTFPSSQIHVVAVYKNRLYLGGESGIATLQVTVDDILKVNFYDPSIWEIDTSTGPVHSFLPVSGTLRSYNGPSGFYNEVLLTADSTMMLLHDTDEDTVMRTVPLNSTVTVIRYNDNSQCWIGTEDDFFWYWDVSDFKKITIPGPTFVSVNRVLVDRKGTLWVLPYGYADGNPYVLPWWVGINSFDGNVWKNFSPIYYPAMGHMGASTVAQAILQTRDERMWFGFEAGQIKCYDPSSDEWWHYCVFGQDQGDGTFVKRKGPCPPGDWGKCDALAQDSAGYMWISSWNNFKGSLLCYKPSVDETEELTGTYRRFPPIGDANRPEPADINTITIDRSRNIIYGTESGTVRIVRYEGDPLQDGIRVVAEFTSLQKIFKAVTLPDNSTLVLTAKGVYRFEPSDTTLTFLEDFDRNVTTLDVEDDNILWYGIPGKGIVRFNMVTNDKTVFNRAQGLVSTQINDVYIDKKNGYVWAATDEGVSRLSLGYTAAPASEKKTVVYPNPFSRRRHEVIYFQDIPREGSIRIHSLNGNLVAAPTLLRKGAGGESYEWRPSSRIPAGTYFYVIIAPNIRKTGKLILTP